MLPRSDGISARRFPIVNVALILANFAVWAAKEDKLTAFVAASLPPGLLVVNAWWKPLAASETIELQARSVALRVARRGE